MPHFSEGEIPPVRDFRSECWKRSSTSEKVVGSKVSI
jgi:hypothetical protein